jgi:hypothetical protein
MLDNTKLASILIAGGIFFWVLGFLFTSNSRNKSGLLTWISVAMILAGVFIALLELGGQSYWFAYYVLRPLRELRSK